MHEASADSFPASDAPSFTPTVGAGLRPDQARPAGSLMLYAFRLPIGWKELAARTAREVRADNCLNLAAQLAFYFFLALFPALLFLVALISFLPVNGLLDGITGDARARGAGRRDRASSRTRFSRSRTTRTAASSPSACSARSGACRPGWTRSSAR